MGRAKEGMTSSRQYEQLSGSCGMKRLRAHGRITERGVRAHESGLALSFIRVSPLTLSESLLYARQCSRLWGYTNQQNIIKEKKYPLGAYILIQCFSKLAAHYNFLRSSSKRGEKT